MIICIPVEERVSAIIRSSYLVAKRTSETKYSLKGETFQMCEITASQVIVLPDTADVTEGAAVTEELQAQALPLETFVSVSAEEALPNALGLLLRLAVADGRLTDEELLSIQPVLEGRLWQPGLSVQVGDVYTFGAFLWRCLQAHTTQANWPPDLVPALWRKVEIIHEDEVRIWQAGMDYESGDVLAYPDAEGELYECIQAHTSQEGWEPPNTPTLWAKQNAV